MATRRSSGEPVAESRPLIRKVVPGSWVSGLTKLRDSAAAMMSQARDRSDLLQIESALPPVERHLARTALLNGHGLFHHSYRDWRTRRIEKLLELYGIDFFIGRKVLELGCGHAEIGAFFADLGAEVLAVDGRMRTINHARLRHRCVPRLQFAVCDLEQDFSSLGRFDLIINFGLLYHLRDVAAHLGCCFALADDMVLESVVCDSTDPHLVILRDEDPELEEEALHGTGSRPSPFFIERVAAEHGFSIERVFSSDLNSGRQFCYDWEHKDDGSPHDDFVNRRFWRFRRGAGD
ncbi:MAG: class I SAM-dependent methyltransferase [Sphingomonas sp.]